MSNLLTYGILSQSSMLLDQYPTALFAYSSSRKLRASYTGSAIRVRRSSDNTEQDIGFTTSGLLDESSLTSFVGVNNGFVVTWYDQSGNGNNATQATLNQQPQIVSSGTVLTVNSRPSILYDGVNDRLTPGTAAWNLDGTSAYVVMKATTATGGNSVVFGYPDSSRFYVPIRVSNVAYCGYRTSATAFNHGSWDTNTHLYSMNLGASVANSSEDGTAASTVATASGSITGDNWCIGSYKLNATFNSFYKGYVSEVILYGSDKNSVKTGIEGNINKHYAIF